MSLEFPFVYANVESLGKLFYPIIRASVKTAYGWQEFDFLVDTGADVTTLPFSILPILDLGNKPLKKQRTQGVGGIWVETFEIILSIQIGSEELTIRASVVNSKEEALPLLLGKKDIFENKFSLEIDSKKKVTIIKKN